MSDRTFNKQLAAVIAPALVHGLHNVHDVHDTKDQPSRILVFTYCNHGYVPMVRNLAMSLTVAGCQWRLVVFCLDQACYQELMVPPKANLVCLDFSSQVSGLSQKLQSYFQVEYKKIVFRKLQIVEAIFAYSLDQSLSLEQRPSHIFYLDSDIAVLKDPLPFLVSYLDKTQADIAFQCGESECVNQDLGQRICRGGGVVTHCTNYCSGCFFVKITPETRQLFCYNAEVTELDLSQTKLDGDQDLLNRRIQQQPYRWSIVSLPPLDFPNGYINLRGSRPDLFRTAYLLHYNFVFDHNKMIMMKANGHWWLG